MQLAQWCLYIFIKSAYVQQISSSGVCTMQKLVCFRSRNLFPNHYFVDVHEIDEKYAYVEEFVLHGLSHANSRQISLQESVLKLRCRLFSRNRKSSCMRMLFVNMSTSLIIYFETQSFYGSKARLRTRAATILALASMSFFV